MMPAETPTAMAARNAWLEADNARLRRLLERHDAPAELRHRLRATLGLLREIIRRSAGFRPEAAVYAAHLEDRLLSLVRMHGAIDRSGEVDLHTAFADELVTYTLHEGQRLRLSGPDILLQTRTAQTLGLAIHELAVNAVEHGAGTGSVPAQPLKPSARVRAAVVRVRGSRRRRGDSMGPAYALDVPRVTRRV